MSKTIHVYGFPSCILPEAVKNFMERHTGKGTVYAVKVGQAKIGESRTYAKVQFTTPRAAEIIITRASGTMKLWYDQNSYLKARKDDIGIVSKPKTFLHSMDNVTLHFGCQISKEKFHVLWKCGNVSVKFCLGMKRLYFFLSHSSVEYKLELFYENVWQIELLQSHNHNKRLLLIQLLGSPRVYEKDTTVHHYYKEASDDQWIREVDFTTSGIIGQSSALCLEIPGHVQLPDLTETFVFYKESSKNITFLKGSCFSSNPNLVPIIKCPRDIDLPYKILFKVNGLVQHGCIPGPVLDAEFYQMVDPSRINVTYIEHALEKLFYLKECCYEPVKWLAEEYRSYSLSKQLPASPSISSDAALVYIHRVQVTPSRLYFCGPELNLSNRVIRHYASDIDNFLRVSFVDEEMKKMHSADLVPHSSSTNEGRRTKIYDRILSILRDGIVVGDKKFEFLAFSSSQLRENSAWMFASRTGLTAADIRKWMGDFSRIRNVAKYSARLGQSFSSSRETMNVGRNEIEMIPDIEVETDGIKYTFSDGIGKISAELARQVAKRCGYDVVIPSAFQIRYGGFKGVVAVDPTSSTKLALRKSMLKYESDNTKLDVLSWSRYQPCFLNRQLITLLSTLGIRDSILEKKQREAIAQLDGILTDPLKAHEALDCISPGDNSIVLKEMLKCGYKPDTEPFLSIMLRAFRATKLLDIRVKARIYIPNGRALMGCLDETGLLDYGQVFIQVSCSRSKHFPETSLVREKVVVAKNPCLHPGDMRVLEAVDVPALHHMVDCIVFPQRGKRPHPNECSGSDLDGDVYFVCWDTELIPPRQFEPMDYTPAPTTLVDHDVTIEEVQKYFADYILNDSLGIISNAHVVFADKELLKAESEPCIELAKLCSVAVDFPKTGVPAEIPHELRIKEYPDFMEKDNKQSYVSQHVIGKLYREVKDIVPSSSTIGYFTREVATRSYDTDMEVYGFREYITEAVHYKERYDYKLGNLMDYYGIKTEAEILSGNIIKVSKSFDRRRDLEGISYAVNALRKEVRDWFSKRCECLPNSNEAYALASAWYHVTYHPKYWGSYNIGFTRDHFISFPWCVYEKLLEIRKSKIRARKIPRSSLLWQLGQDLQMVNLRSWCRIG